MKHLVNRIISFKKSKTEMPDHLVVFLAQNGFSMLHKDIVLCFKCGSSYVLNTYNINVILSSHKLCVASKCGDNMFYIDKPCYDLNVKYLESRAKSFKHSSWETDAIRLAESGFFLNNSKDTIMTFCCNLLVDENDLLEKNLYGNRQRYIDVHMDISPECCYAKIRSLTEELKSLNDNNSCIICFSRVKSIAFMTCKHICVCSVCLFSIEKCPLCRGRITIVSIVRF